MNLTDGATATSVAYTIDYCINLMTSMIPVGLGLGMIPLIFGLGISGALKILKNP